EAAGSGERGQWARSALERLQDRRAGKAHALGDDYLSLADAEDPFLRELVAFSLNFWEGDEQENKRIDETLGRLSRDMGKGEELLAQLTDDEDTATQTITKYPGLKVRYNATIALARRGSPRVSLPMLKEMLDESAQMDNFRRKLTNGKEVADEALARQTVVTTLQAIAELHREAPQLDLSELRPAIDKLAESDNVLIRTEVKNTQSVLDKPN